jgi:hypothetical protein
MNDALRVWLKADRQKTDVAGGRNILAFRHDERIPFAASSIASIEERFKEEL